MSDFGDAFSAPRPQAIVLQQHIERDVGAQGFNQRLAVERGVARPAGRCSFFLQPIQLVELEPQVSARFTFGHRCCLHYWVNAAPGPVRTQ